MGKGAIQVKRKSKPKPDKPKTLWHVTSESLVPDILRDGLKAGMEAKNRPEPLKRPSIFTLTDPHDELTMNLAKGQLWLFQDVDSYAVIEIDTAGITGRIVPDEVDNNGFHLVVEQDLIYPKFLKLLKVRKINYPGKAIADMNSGDARRWTEEEWIIANEWFSPYDIAQRRQREDNVPIPPELEQEHLRQIERAFTGCSLMFRTKE